MRKLDEVMLNHMKYIIFAEKRPFSYLDFKSFKVQGKEYSMKHGTFRNKISRLVGDANAELQYKSNIAFYTLKGVNFGKKKNMMTPIMTPNHTGVNSVTNANSVIMNNNIIDTSPPICDVIPYIPPDKNALHDIHYKFEVPDIWNILYHSKKYRPNAVSKDIAVNVLNTSQLKITTTVHRTDSVTVIVACSDTPVAVDTHGLIRLSNALTRVEERLSRVIDECGNSIPGGYESIPIPNNETWEVTMWHFGYDSPLEYAGPKFCATWRDGQDALALAVLLSPLSFSHLTAVFANHGQEISLTLNSAQFIPLSSGEGNQVKVTVNYTAVNSTLLGQTINAVMINSTLLGQTINAVMKVYAPNQTAIKMTSFPSGFTVNNSVIQELKTTITDNQTQNVTAVIQFTDVAKTIPISNPIQVNLNLTQPTLEDVQLEEVKTPEIAALP